MENSKENGAQIKKFGATPCSSASVCVICGQLAHQEDQGGFFLLSRSEGLNDDEGMGLSRSAAKSVGCLLALTFWFLLALCAAAAETLPTNSARVTHTVLTNVLSSFQVKPGFRLELAAVEPMVTAPVAMAFDENGRLFVVEMRDAAQPQEATPHLGRIRLLEDVEADGAYRSSTVYAEDLVWPSAVACYAGGIFVATASQILYLKDSKADGVVDVRRTILTGFGGTNALNSQTVLNNFNWGLDNRIHGATAGLGGVITAPNGPLANSISLAGSDFSFDPRTSAVFPEAGPAQSGLSFDNDGRRFESDFIRPLRLAMYAPRYAARNPYFPRLPEMLDCAGTAPPILHFVSMTAPKPGTVRSTGGNRLGPAVMLETKVLAPGWLTNAHGCAVYRGSAFPTNYLNSLFIADPDAHVIHHAVLRENGLELLAERAADERNTEFLLCKDSAFRPVQVICGPDGVLYVADLQDGYERGRIFRIVPENFRRPKLPQLGKARTYDLVASLAQPDGWHRDTAARLLFERQDPAAVLLLSNMLNRAKVPLARLHALHALEGCAAFQEANLVSGLQDADDRVREHSVALCERLARDGAVSDTLWDQLKPLAGDPALRVRYQLALSLGEIRRPDKARVLAEILNRDRGNAWIQNAALSSTAEGAGSLFVLLAGDAWFRSDSAEFLRQLALMTGAKGRMDEVIQVLDFIDQSALGRTEAFGLLATLGEGLRRTHSSLALVDSPGRLARFYSQALEAMADEKASKQTRLEAVRLLGVSPSTFADIGSWLLLLCEPRQPASLQSAALAVLGRYGDPNVLNELLKRLPALALQMRNQAIGALLSRNDRLPALLAAIEDGRISPADFSSTQKNFLRTHHDSAISQRAVRLFGPVPVHRPETLDQYKSALRLAGTADHGQAIFSARCASCHQAHGNIQPLGPDLTAARFMGKEKLLEAIVEPNAVVAPTYAPWTAETQAGESLIGIKEDESLAAITLRQLDGTRAVWPRLNLQAIEARSWSFMPVGLEEGLSPQDMADLLDYVTTGADLRGR